MRWPPDTFRDPTLSDMEFTAIGGTALLTARHLPLLAWAPRLTAVTWAYWRRRCRD